MDVASNATQATTSVVSRWGIDLDLTNIGFAAVGNRGARWEGEPCPWMNVVSSYAAGPIWFPGRRRRQRTIRPGDRLPYGRRDSSVGTTRSTRNGGRR